MKKMFKYKFLNLPSASPPSHHRLLQVLKGSNNRCLIRFLSLLIWGGGGIRTEEKQLSQNELVTEQLVCGAQKKVPVLLCIEVYLLFGSLYHAPTIILFFSSLSLSCV